MPYLELAYQADASHYFQSLIAFPYAIWLDSCHPYQPQGRFDVMSAKPRVIFQTKEKLTTVIRDTTTTTSHESIFDLIKIALEQLPQINSEPPFTIGALGYFGYDIGRGLEHLINQLPRDIALPDACVGIYDWSLVVDHEQRKAWLFYLDAQQLAEIQAMLATKKELQSFMLTAPFKADMSREAYDCAFAAIKQHLVDGDCYQVNLCQRFSTGYTGSSFAAYLELRRKSPAPFAAYMQLPEGALLSLSPERFLQVQDNEVLTQPIKGTSPRYNDPEQDRASAQALLNSHKDRAENLMIVDLLRNDLSHSCKPGSVKVPRLFELQSFSNVHHLVSSIRAELTNDQSPLDVLRHCFPGGSITGAPKISAMQIIEEQEQQARSIYCGCIGYCSVDGKMDMNIAIRTLICARDKIYAYAGGGIVIDSDCEAEYQESLIKITNLLRALHG